MWADVTEIDETLLRRRDIVRVDADEPGLGYYVRLSCGHQIWTPVRPDAPIHCGACLQVLYGQIRNVQQQQQAG